MKPLYRHVQSFKAGEIIPDWLISVDPVDGNSAGAEVVFGTDVDVMETDEIFIMLPIDDGPFCRVFGPFNVRIHAATKPIYYMQAVAKQYPEGTGLPGLKTIRFD